MATSAKKTPIILLVEDDSIVSLVLKNLLEGLGCEVVVAKTGEEALVLTDTSDATYDLIFMDIGLPGIDGLTVTQRIREKEQQLGAHIVIVALTGHIQPEDQQQCFRAGMDDFIAKPADAEKLASILAKYKLI